MSRFTMAVFTAIILKRDNRICLLKRSANAKYHPSKYAIPGGGVDGNERTTDATVRETLEKLGVHIKAQDLSCVHTMHVKAPDSAEYINFFMTTNNFEGKPTATEPDKCDGVDWFSLDELPENIMPMHKHVLEMIKKSIPFSEYGF